MGGTSSKLYTSSLVSAKPPVYPRSLLKLDQAYIAVGGREHLTLVRETDIMRIIALRNIYPCREMQQPACRGVPGSTQIAQKIYLCRVEHAGVPTAE